MKRRMAVAAGLALCSFLLSGIAGHANTVGNTATCDVNGIDPDTVTLSAPAGGPVVVTASETASEGAVVASLHVIVTSNGGSPVLTEASSVGTHSTSVTFHVASGHTYTLDWVATFDYGIHPCAWFLPGQAAFTVST